MVSYVIFWHSDLWRKTLEFRDTVPYQNSDLCFEFEKLDLGTPISNLRYGNYEFAMWIFRFRSDIPLEYSQNPKFYFLAYKCRSIFFWSWHSYCDIQTTEFPSSLWFWNYAFGIMILELWFWNYHFRIMMLVSRVWNYESGNMTTSLWFCNYDFEFRNLKSIPEFPFWYSNPRMVTLVFRSL